MLFTKEQMKKVFLERNRFKKQLIDLKKLLNTKSYSINSFKSCFDI
jgi:hypothetical protein